MVIKMDDSTVKAGRLIRVYNTDKRPAANKWYYSVWVEDCEGDNERCLLFTEKEIERAQKRANKNTEDLTKKSIVSDIFD